MPSKAQSAEPPAVWKPPPPAASYPGGAQAGARVKEGAGARLSPDSGRGSDRTGSDSSNSYPDHHRPSHSNGYNMPKSSSASHIQQPPDSAYGFAKQQSMPALRPPAYRPPPAHAAQGRNSSPAEPPPYREPPPPAVRPPHYSPPPTHRTPHLSRHPSRGSLVGGPRGYPQHGLPFRQQPYYGYQQTDFSELMNLVSAQQTTLQSQHAEIKQVITMGFA